MISGRYSRLIGVAIVAAALCIPLSALQAATGVDNLVLSPNGEFTELTVVGGGHTLCNHFTEPAKDGAPFRIVLDFCDASHGLRQMQFTDLPKTRIRRIRTSQFATSPQMIVRVVLDMVDEATYSVVRDGSSLTVRVVDPNRATFATWTAEKEMTHSSTTVMATATPKSQTPSAPSVAVTKPAPVVAQKEAKKEIQAEQPVPQPPVKKSTPVVAQKPATQPAPVKEPVITTPTPARNDEPTVAMERSKTEAFIPPKTPLVFAPEVLENPNAPMTVAQTPAQKSGVLVSKETMHPMGPMPGSPSATGATASTKAQDAQWASTTAPEQDMKSTSTGTPVFAHNQQQQFAMTTPNDMAAVNDEEPLIERLKQKFFGEQSAPRPYTTVGDGQAPSEMQGPPSPNVKISREELLARIREAQRRVASGEYRHSETGAGGVPTRQILYYDDMGRRDPFNPLVTGQRSGFISSELPNVETLRLVGILHDDHEALALLENLEGYGYILRVGDPVKNGSMIAIQNTRALFRIDDYGWTHTVALQLTSRGTDPSKSLGAVQQEYPTYDNDTEGNKTNGNSTGNQGSEGE